MADNERMGMSEYHWPGGSKLHKWVNDSWIILLMEYDSWLVNDGELQKLTLFWVRVDEPT